MSMRHLKKFGVALAMMLVVGAAVAGTASAADPLFLFSTKPFTVSGGAGTLSTLGGFFSIECKKLEGSGETAGTDTDTAKGTITFKECTGTSLGAASGVITYKYNAELCWINEAKLEVGEYIEAAEPVHIEIPFVGLLIFEKGSADVAAVTPVAVKTKTLTAKLETSGTGDQKVTSCVGLTGTKKPAITVHEREEATAHDGAIATSFTVTPEKEGTLDG
jgi:hypothetical protein